MANTYSAIYLHIIFAVKNRESLLDPFFREQVFQYMGAICSAHGHHPIQIGGTSNHVHLAICYNINETIPDFIKELKTSTNKFINQRSIRGHFEWQRGYAAFSVSQSQLEVLKNYIHNQNVHHSGMTLTEETKKFLKAYNISFDERYIFEDIAE